MGLGRVSTGLLMAFSKTFMWPIGPPLEGVYRTLYLVFITFDEALYSFPKDPEFTDLGSEDLGSKDFESKEIWLFGGNTLDFQGLRVQRCKA